MSAPPPPESQSLPCPPSIRSLPLPRQPTVARPAEQTVVSVAARDGVIALAAIQPVAARVARQLIVRVVASAVDAGRAGQHELSDAVAWVAANPDITAPIISARSPEQLEQSLRAMGLKLGKDLHRRISALSRAPASATDRSEDPSPFAAVSVVE